jgi:cytoskeletal protein CcmA (bactofilin family)
LSYFSQNKSDRDSKKVVASLNEAKVELTTPPRKVAQGTENVSTLGPGLMITGNVVSTGSVRIHGRVFGDIHAAYLTISKGAYVEGNVLAQEAIIEGDFKGTIHGNSVKLQATAVVEGEIYKQSLVIEQNAQFEGVSRRLPTQIEAPTEAQVNPAARTPAAAPVTKIYATNGAARTGEDGATPNYVNGGAANVNAPAAS